MGAMKAELMKLQDEVAVIIRKDCCGQELPEIYEAAEKIVWLVVERTLRLHGMGGGEKP